MSVIIDRKKISQKVKKRVKEKTSLLSQNGIIPPLSVILVGDNAPSAVYVRSKARACKKTGISSETIRMDKDTTEAELLTRIDELNNNDAVHGILVQLPLPGQINEETIIEAIDPEKDVDGFHPLNVGRLVSGADNCFLPCTPAGIMELLHQYDISTRSKKVTIIGRSNIV